MDDVPLVEHVPGIHLPRFDAGCGVVRENKSPD
jgi:hypothetical protein